MSKTIGLLLVIAVALGLFIAFNPEARERAMDAWEQVKIAWEQFSEDFSASMGTLMAGFRDRFDGMSSSSQGEEPAAAEDENAGTSVGARLSIFLRNLWLNISSNVSVDH